MYSVYEVSSCTTVYNVDIIAFAYKNQRVIQDAVIRKIRGGLNFFVVKSKGKFSGSNFQANIFAFLHHVIGSCL